MKRFLSIESLGTQTILSLIAIVAMSLSSYMAGHDAGSNPEAGFFRTTRIVSVALLMFNMLLWGYTLERGNKAAREISEVRKARELALVQASAAQQQTLAMEKRYEQLQSSFNSLKNELQAARHTQTETERLLNLEKGRVGFEAAVLAASQKREAMLADSLRLANKAVTLQRGEISVLKENILKLKLRKKTR